MKPKTLRLLSKMIMPLVFLSILIFYHLGTSAVVDKTLSYLLVGPVSILILLCIVYIVVKEVLAYRNEAEPTAQKETKGSRSLKENLGLFLANRQLMLLLFVFLYILVLPLLGTFLTTVIVPMLMMFYLGIRSRKVLFLVPLGLSLFVTIIFQIVMKISLPWGILSPLSYLLL